MATNGAQPGKILTITASGAVTSGSVQQVGDRIIGVALNAASGSGVDYPLAVEGVFTIGKKTSETWAVGDRLYWNSSATTASKTYAAGAADKFVGVATAVAASAATTGNVRLGETPAIEQADLSGVMGTADIVAYEVTVTNTNTTVTTPHATAGFTAGKPRWATINNNSTNAVSIVGVYDSGTDFIVKLSGDPGASGATIGVWSDER